MQASNDNETALHPGVISLIKALARADAAKQVAEFLAKADLDKPQVDDSASAQFETKAA